MTTPVHFPLPPSPALRLAADLDISSVWRASELSGESLPTLDTGYANLNRELPGGGWPQGAMVEVLQPQAGQHEWGLLAPVLAALQASSEKSRSAPAWLVLTGAPYLPFGPALRARQISMQRLLCIHPDPEPGQAPRCSGPRVKRCCALMWRLYWPGCRRRAARIYAACRLPPTPITSCCSSSGRCGRGMNPRLRRCGCCWKAMLMPAVVAALVCRCMC